MSCKKSTIEKKKSNSNNNAKLPPSGSKSVARSQSAKCRTDKVKKASAALTKNLKSGQKDRTSASRVCTNDESVQSGSSVQEESDSGTAGDSDSGVTSCYSPSAMMLVPVGGKQVPVVDVGGDAPFPSYHFFLEKRSEKHVSSDVRGFVFTSSDPIGDLRPITANLTDVDAKIQTQNKIRKRPSSAKSSRVKTDYLQEDITPAVFGMQNNRQVFGNTQEIGSTNSGTCVYKMSDVTQDRTRVQGLNQIQKYVYNVIYYIYIMLMNFHTVLLF